MHYPFPYCSLAEQREIVRRLEQKLSIVDQLSADLRHALEQAGGLRHSILKRGFAGELVDQNSSDEPASVLVKRIQAEREIHNSRSNKKRKVAS
jgi:type I restriction enzyme S subunit